ncbi:hypothetical protein ACIQ34_19780 [Ureibacillus sp. NPDC094379]
MFRELLADLTEKDYDQRFVKQSGHKAHQTIMEHYINMKTSDVDGFYQIVIIPLWKAGVWKV